MGVAVQLGVLYLMTRALNTNYLVATVLAVEAAILHNFCWHERYTWKTRTEADPRGTLRRLMRFNLSNGGVSLIGNLVLMKLLVSKFGLPVLAANIGAIATCSTVNFLVAEYFVFARKTEANDGGLFV